MRTAGDEYLEVLQNGLGRTARCRRIVVVGAGMAGIVAAWLLSRAGHSVTVIEARQRLGGRIRTEGDAFGPGLHAELGAMRIPCCHRLTRALVRRLKLPVRPFVSSCDANIINVGSEFARRIDYDADPAVVGGSLPRDARGKKASELLLKALRQPLEGTAHDPDGSSQYDGVSLRSFLQSRAGYPEATIRWITLLEDSASLIDCGLGETLRNLHRAWGEAGYEAIVGGLSRLPEALQADSDASIEYRTRLLGITGGVGGLTLHSRAELAAVRQERECDRVILTVPFSVLRGLLPTIPLLSKSKQEAIRSVQYDSAVKVLLHFRYPFWLDEGIDGGCSVTDHPVRFVYYPAVEETVPAGGVLLASYTWGSDAGLWQRLSAQARRQLALEGIQRLHGRHVARSLVDCRSIDWGNEPFSRGAYAHYLPGQGAELRGLASAPEHGIHFAGEHTSSWNAWIEGAVESGVRAALEVD